MVETPLRRSRRIRSQSDDEASVASSRGSRAAASNSISQRATKGGLAASKKELEAIPETIVAAGGADGVRCESAAATPAKSARKKRKKDEAGDVSKVAEQVEVERTKEETKIAADIHPEADDSFVEATPAKSDPKNLTKDAPGGDSAERKGKEDTKKEVTTRTPNESSTTTTTTKKKKKQNKPTEGEELHDAASDKASTPKLEGKFSSSKDAPNPNSKASLKNAAKKSINLQNGGNTERVPDASSDKASNPKSEDKSSTTLAISGKNAAKKSLRFQGGSIQQDNEESLPPSGTGCANHHRSMKKRHNTEETSAVETSPYQEGTSCQSAEDESLKVSKNYLKRLRRSTDAPHAAAAPANTAEKLKKQTEDIKPTQPENSKKKRSRTTSTDVSDASTPKPEDKSSTTNPTPKVSQKHSSKKSTSIKKTAKGGDKSSTKKISSPHKKDQNYKHDRPSVSPSPNRKLSYKLYSHDESLSPPRERLVKPNIIMDVKVHRLRFLKLHPKSILSMATTPLHSPAANSDHHQPRHPARLAISREGGSVELLSPQDRWVSVGHIPGVRGREVDALVWIYGKRGQDDDNNGGAGTQQSRRISLVDEQMRLFGCSRDGTIFELDFASKRQTSVIGSGGGGVFCLASMCSRKKSRTVSFGGYFAAGCEDGTIKIYTAFGSNGGGTAPEILTLAATLPSAGNAILSLAWLPGQSGHDDGGMGGSVIFAGVADGTIRRFDCVTSIVTGPISTGSVIAPSRSSASINYRWKSTLRMTVENRGLRESTKVWALEALSDGTVISGDSLGHVQIWDGMSGTMTQTFNHNESGADVLCLAVSEDENKIFASGIDSSVRCIQRQSSTFTAEGERKWISSNSHRKHSHDVKALAICHKATSNNSNPLELLVSGSVDTRICSYVVEDFKSNRPKIWYNWPTLSPISLSRKQRLLAVTRDNRVDLYRLIGPAMADPAKIMFPETRDESKSLVKTISIQSPFNLTCSVISEDGKFLAASDAVSLYVFSLVVEDKDGILDVRPTKIGLGEDCKHPATALKFGEGNLICATNNGPIYVLQISAGSSDEGHAYTISLKHVFKEHMIDWPATSHHFPIVSLDVSSDGKWLAAGRFSSEKGSVHVFTLPTSDDNGHHQHWWAFPEMDAPTTCIKFLGGGSVESSLAVGCSNNEFYIFNLGRRSLSHWSNDMGVPLLKSLPKELTSRSEPVSRIVSNPVAPQRFILVSESAGVLWCCFENIATCLLTFLFISFSRDRTDISVWSTWSNQCQNGQACSHLITYEPSASN
jgi:U3 small nucleolar RNA-associated protein 4